MNNVTLQKDTSNKIVWVQFIASLIIVLDHSFNYIAFVPINKIERIVTILVDFSGKWATNIVMPVFFFLSGFLLFKEKPEEEYGKWYIQKLKSRFFSLVIPFICWNTVWCVFFLILGRAGLSSGNVDTGITFQNILSGVFKYKYNEVFWYIYIY